MSTENLFFVMQTTKDAEQLVRAHILVSTFDIHSVDCITTRLATILRFYLLVAAVKHVSLTIACSQTPKTCSLVNEESILHSMIHHGTSCPLSSHTLNVLFYCLVISGFSAQICRLMNL